MTLLTPGVEKWIGKQAHYSSQEPLGLASIRYFTRAVWGSDDTSHDAPSGPGGEPLGLPTFVCETNQIYDRHPDEDGYVGHLWDLPLPPHRMLRVRNAYEFARYPTPDDVISASWTLVDISERMSRDGTPTLFVESEVVYRDASDATIAVNRETLAYQPRG